MQHVEGRGAGESGLTRNGGGEKDAGDGAGAAMSRPRPRRHVRSMREAVVFCRKKWEPGKILTEKCTHFTSIPLTICLKQAESGKGGGNYRCLYPWGGWRGALVCLFPLCAHSSHQGEQFCEASSPFAPHPFPQLPVHMTLEADAVTEPTSGLDQVGASSSSSIAVDRVQWLVGRERGKH